MPRPEAGSWHPPAQAATQMLNYNKPTGKIADSDWGHPVLGGWMTKEENDLTTANIYTPSKIPKAIKIKLEQWRKDWAVIQTLKKTAQADHDGLRDFLTKVARDNMATNVTPAPTATIYRYQDFHLQCYLLSLLPRLSIKPEEQSYEDWAVEGLGLKSIDDVYPVITQKGIICHLEDLIYSFGYGPNYFDWRKRKPFMLKGASATLYLVSIDIGQIAGSESHIIWKVGITKGEVIGGNPKKSRFSGEIATYIKILRQKRYVDARNAFMIEQVIMDCSKRDTAIDIYAQSDPFEPEIARKVKSFLLFSELPSNVQNKLGYSEWIYKTKSQKEVEEVFDRLTAYPEFYDAQT